MDLPNFKDTIAASPYIFTIGVAGDSGSGKTTFTEGIRKIFGEELVSTITLDDYHKMDRTERQKEHVTALDPRANRLDELERDLFRLRCGVPIEKPVYNHATGTFDPPVIFRPGKILILEGLHTLFTPTLRKYIDFSLFVDPAQPVKYDWKILRDTGKRGYTRESVLEEIAEREPDYRRYIAPQREFADAVIGIGYSEFGKELGQARNVYRVSLSQTRMKKSIADIDLAIDIFSLLSLSSRDFSITFGKSGFEGHDMGMLTVDGELGSHIIRKLEHSIEQQTGVLPVSLFHDRDYVTAVNFVQLVLCWRIIHQRIFLEKIR